MTLLKFAARPANPDGRDRLGTEGVLAGEYSSYRNFLRYKFLPHHDPTKPYNIYAVTYGGYVLVETRRPKVSESQRA